MNFVDRHRSGRRPRPRLVSFWHLSIAVGLAAAVTTPGCGDNEPNTRVAPKLTLVPVSPGVTVKPGKAAPVSFLLTTMKGIPIAGERLDFAAVDDPATPTSELGGATLSASSGPTDAHGVGTVIVTGGVATHFRLSARHLRADVAEVLVTVSEGDPGAIEVVSSVIPGATSEAAVVAIDLLLYEGASCTALPGPTAPQTIHRLLNLAPEAPGWFDIVTAAAYAVVAEGRDAAKRVRAEGCIDVPANTVVSGSTARVYLPLIEVAPRPLASFALSSRFSLARREIVHQVAAPWQDLGDCPLDPGQQWLDCAIDALGSPPGDALDCVPAAVGEGELADLISARRGSVTASSSCRAATLAGGGPSLDAKVAALFPSPAQSPARDIDALGKQVASMFDDITLGSTLQVSPTAKAGVYQGTHTLRTILFAIGTQGVTVDIVAQGIPSAQARLVPMTTAGDLLTVESHSLGLHLGTLARAAFRRAALSVGPVADPITANGTTTYLDRLFELATSGMGTGRTVGCAALDALVCAEIGSAAGCLGAACVAGQAALAQRLDAGFALLDGDGADLQLSGSAVMTDADEDGLAEELGGTANDPGLWVGQIRARSGTETFSGSWAGMPP